METVVYVGQVIILSKYVIPAFEGMTLDGKFISDDLRTKNLLINNCVAFVITNIFTYFTNGFLVFKQGRHSPWLEFFTLLSST